MSQQDALSIMDIAKLWSAEPGKQSASEIHADLWCAFWRGEFPLSGHPLVPGAIDRAELATLFEAEKQGPNGSRIRTAEYKLNENKAEAILDQGRAIREQQANFETLSGWAGTGYEGMDGEFIQRLDRLYVYRGDLLKYCASIHRAPPAFWIGNREPRRRRVGARKSREETFAWYEQRIMEYADKIPPTREQDQDDGGRNGHTRPNIRDARADLAPPTWKESGPRAQAKAAR